MTSIELSPWTGQCLRRAGVLLPEWCHRLSGLGEARKVEELVAVAEPVGPARALGQRGHGKARGIEVDLQHARLRVRGAQGPAFTDLGPVPCRARVIAARERQGRDDQGLVRSYFQVRALSELACYEI